MSKGLTVIGGASGLGRHMIQRLSGAYADIDLADMYPFRQAVYGLQASLGTQTTLHIHPLLNKANMKAAVQDTQDLLYITHDYFKMAHSKNFYLKSVERAAQGKERVVVVLPVEYDFEDHREVLDGLIQKVP